MMAILALIDSAHTSRDFDYKLIEFQFNILSLGL